MTRYAWAAPASLVGLAAALVACCAGARPRRVAGVLEVAGGGLATFATRAPGARRFGAITLGHVVLGVDETTLARSRAHEHAHVRQYERWGILFFPLYLGASLAAWLRGGEPYGDNHFERAACAEAAFAQRHENA